MKRGWLITAVLAMVSTAWLRAQTPEAQVLEFFKTYDAAFTAKDLNKLATLYHPDVTIFEGAGINRGWIDYRDNHIGPELKSFEGLQWAHTNIVVHMLGESAAYVTADYSIKYQSAGRTVDGGGIATHVLVKDQGQWKIRHSMTASRRRPAGGTPQNTEFQGTVAAIDKARVQVKLLGADQKSTGQSVWFAITDKTVVHRGPAAVAFMDAKLALDETITIAVAPGDEAGTEWACPMHSDVVKPAAGQCPICSMTLKERPRPAKASEIRLAAK